MRQFRKAVTWLTEEALCLLVAALLTWLVMLAVGAAHHADAQIPALSFWAVWWLLIAIHIAAMWGRLMWKFDERRKERR